MTKGTGTTPWHRTIASRLQADADQTGDGIWTLIHDGERPTTINWTRGTANHWSKMAAKTREWRHAYWARAKQAAIPFLEVMEFEIVPLHKDLRSPQDVGACAPAAKAAIDGIVCAIDGQPWDAANVNDGPGRVLGVMYRPPACGVGVDGLMIVVRAMGEFVKRTKPVDRTLVVPVGQDVTSALARHTGRVDHRLWGVELGRILDDAVAG